jgi:hypothetical protein
MQNYTMRMKNKYGELIWFFSLALIVNSYPCLAQSSAEKQGFNLDQWFTHYYQHPQPNLTVEAILAMSTQGHFDKETAQSPLAAFFSQLFAQNPQSIQTWFSKLDKLPDHHKKVLWVALWHSATPQATEQLKLDAGKASGQAKANLQKLIATTPPSIATLEITSPSVLDMFWASFMATGDERYVLRIISALSWVNERENLPRLMIGGAARWSLTSNCIQHQKVLEICKAQVSKQDSETVSILKELIKQAETKKH